MPIGRQLQTNITVTDTAIVSSGITLNTATSTTVAADNKFRLEFYLSNDNNQEIWLKLQPASVDNDEKGILLPRNSTYEMPTENVYTGEISAIAKTGNPIVFITEY